MGKRLKQVTCFDADTMRKIKAEIQQLAANHNRLIINPTLSKLTMRTALETFVEPQWQPSAVQTYQRFSGQLRSEAYQIRYRSLRALPNEARLRFYWHNEAAFKDPSCFVIADADQNLPLGRALQATPWAAEFVERLDEWIGNAIEWGVVLQTFEWLNENVKPRDYGHAVFLLPTLVPLIARFQKAWADALAKLKPPMRAPVDANFLPALQFANQKLAGAFLLPSDDTATGAGPVWATVQDAGYTRHPAWPGTISPYFVR